MRRIQRFRIGARSSDRHSRTGVCPWLPRRDWADSCIRPAGRTDERKGAAFGSVDAKIVPVRLAVASVLIGLPLEVAAEVTCVDTLRPTETGPLKIGVERDGRESEQENIGTVDLRLGNRRGLRRLIGSGGLCRLRGLLRFGVTLNLGQLFFNEFRFRTLRHEFQERLHMFGCSCQVLLLSENHREHMLGSRILMPHIQFHGFPPAFLGGVRFFRFRLARALKKNAAGKSYGFMRITLPVVSETSCHLFSRAAIRYIPSYGLMNLESAVMDCV